MDKKSQQTLELPKILARLADHANFSVSRELSLALAPSTDPIEVRRRQAETTEARALLDMKPGLSVGGARDTRDYVRRALIQAVLEPKELLDILATLQSGRALRTTITRLADRYPVLNAIASRLRDCPALEREITRCITERGDVADDASPALRRIRVELRQAHDRLVTKLNDMLASSDVSGILQDPIITLRGDRYVLPIRAEKKGNFRGIVHDQSASGATLFMEPLATVELNNRWRTMQIEEQQEILRVLRRLSEAVAGVAVELDGNLQALGELDLAFAKASYSAALRAVEPELRDLPRKKTVTAAAAISPSAYPLYLRQARHPLLTGDVVPITVYFGDDVTALVITGPNTGGKTVALKTVGLLCLMAQSGLHIPAGEGSAVPFFERIFADIGDEQSIEQSLSTFSSHLTNIIHILAEADESSLVLLDELGAGTDPVEGSALALAILQHLLQKRIMTLVATHYAELKAWAYTTPSVQNASVEFDVETLSPTYRLSIGLPGRSNALAIAARLGLDPQIIETARQMISPAQMQIEALLFEIQRERGEAEAARIKMEADREAANRLRQEIAAERRAIEDERRRILSDARSAAETELQNVRAQLRRLMTEAESSRSRVQIAAALQQTKDVGDALPRVAGASSPSDADPGAPVGGAATVGDTVWVPSLNLLGEVVSGPDQQNTLDVQVGSFKTKVFAGEVEKRTRGRAPSSPATRVSLAAQPVTPLQLDLRGWRAEDVEPALDRYLNDAYMAGMPFVRIVHGKGTGVLRQVVKEIVAKHALVKSSRSGEAGEGGDGVTVVVLAV
jgi:DNA mismatch repair protein MutS2